MKKILRIFVFTLILSISATTVYATNVYYTFSPFGNKLKGIGAIIESEHVYGNLDLKANYEKYVADSFRPTPAKDYFTWNYAVNIGGGYRYRGILMGPDIGYLHQTQTYMHLFEDATSTRGYLTYGFNLGFKLHHLFLGFRYGNIETFSFKVGIAF